MGWGGGKGRKKKAFTYFSSRNLVLVETSAVPCTMVGRGRLLFLHGPQLKARSRRARILSEQTTKGEGERSILCSDAMSQFGSQGGQCLVGAHRASFASLCLSRLCSGRSAGIVGRALPSRREASNRSGHCRRPDCAVRSLLLPGRQNIQPSPKSVLYFMDLEAKHRRQSKVVFIHEMP